MENQLDTVAHHGIIWNFKLINTIEKQLVRQYSDIRGDSIVAVLIVITEMMKNIDSTYDYSELRKFIKDYFSANSKFLAMFGIKNNNLGLIDRIF